MARLRPSFALALALASFAPAAQAQVQVVPPRDWVSASAVDPSAQQRVTRWGAALGGELVSMHASAGIDGFVETMAVFEVTKAMPIGVVGDSDAAARWLDEQVAKITGGAAAEDMAWAQNPNTLTGFAYTRYALDDVHLSVLAIPDGPQTTFVLMASKVDEEIFYGPIFQDVRDTLTGGAKPVHPYDISAHRGWTFAAWFAALLAVYGISIAAFSERRGDHRRVARFAAMILGGLAVVVGVLVFLALRDLSPSLALAGTSAKSLAAETFGVGALMAGIAFVLGQVLESGNQRVASAPVNSNLAARVQAAQAEKKHDEFV